MSRQDNIDLDNEEIDTQNQDDSLFGEEENEQDDVSFQEDNQGGYDLSEGQRPLSSLPMKDLYLYIHTGCENEEVSYNPTHQEDDSTDCLYIHDDTYDEDIISLRETLREKAHLEDFEKGIKPLRRKFAITHDGIRYRVSCYAVLDNKVYCSMRRFPKELPDINKLNLSKRHIEIFRAVGKTRKKGGIIIVGGRTGAGKTTTLIAMIRMFLQEFGGFLYTVEDPIEYVLQGRFRENPDRANIIQREVETEEEWGEGIEDALRSAPQYIFVGEIRTPLAAAQAIRAASTGHLVIATTHGGSIIQTISNIMNIARVEMGELAAPQLSDCLRLVAHQEIKNGKPLVSTLSFDGDDSPTLRNKVADGISNIKQLETYIEQQKNKAQSSGTFGNAPTRPQQRPNPNRPAPQRPQQPPRKPEPPKKKGLFSRK